MNEIREEEKKKVTAFGMTTVIIPLILVAIVVVGWFIYSAQNRVPPDAADVNNTPQTTVPQ